LKEVEHYKDEVVMNEKKVDEMKRDTSKDIYDVRRFEDILNESCMMVPDSSKRLQLAIADLSTYIANNNHLIDSSGSWYQAAQAILLGNKNAVVNMEHRVTSYTTYPVPETRVDDLAEGEAF
jgi:tubulin-specific chaperone A